MASYEKRDKQHKVASSNTFPYLYFGSYIGVITALVGAFAVISAELPVWLGYGLGVNVAALILVGLDKKLARGSSLRVPEKVLFAAAILGGTLGILLGMRSFRHKTKKSAFQFVIGLIAVVQIVTLGLWAT